MKPTEAVILTRFVEACCPQQKIDDYTPDAWYDVLADLSLDDCRKAVEAVAARQPFVAPAEIRAEVSRIRANRLEGFVYVPGDADEDTAAYLRRYREQRAAVADGQREADPTPQLGTEGNRKAVAEVLAGAFPTPPKRVRP